MKIVLTGHLGFVGSSLKLYLENKDHTVYGLDIKNNQDILTCDLPDCDTVIHLAALTGVLPSLLNPEEYWNTNVNGTRRVLSHYSNIRTLVASSSSQYEPYLNPYAASKHTMETIPHTNVCWMRFHTVYGPTVRKDMFLDKLQKGTLKYVTDHQRDFIHIDDLCDAIDILLNNDYTGPVDIGTGITTKISSICPTLPIVTDTPYERTSTCADTKIMTELGFRPKHIFASSLSTPLFQNQYRL